ncbi:nitrite/sulfite reductase [Granulicella tundricola]|uniref:Nitrite and sulphite reductase 4Fe-4S region n=1 Tax=Granulicella tundricola (strain ATCC BAA-1859 / DSM 23138 / MP5ACTX9) TaxID=1198114 RepID=E8X1X2_GRATM|nr:nitrite/sulfite reductase [Granulicella tundricola]ADW69133.1 nitrite and sulphite reductase 4Fe-4S region [Granulicella tundricola MP5ACTX9]
MPDEVLTAPAAEAKPKEVKETKAQKSERLKLAKNPWDAWDEVREYAKGGRDSVAPEWSNLYFKWWGVYTQGDGLGVTGGANGEGKASEFFMMRIGLPNGILTSLQLRVIGNLTKKYARNLSDITTRQNIQLHWLTIGALVEVVDALTEIGLSPKGACGDVVRNVTGCPLAGIDGHQLLDASPLALELAHKLTANPEFYNLPRKFKISATGCPLWCSYPEINDVAFTAITREINGATEIGYTLRVGGGLSTEPHIAVRIPAFIPQDKAYDVCVAVVRIFKEQSELRENRTRARIKYLFMRHGWTAESMLEAIEQQLGYKLDPSPLTADPVPDDVYRDHIGITPQKQSGLSAVGASVMGGRLSGDQLIQLADLAEKYGDGSLRATIMQNILLVNIKNENVRALIADLAALDLRVEVSPFWRGAVACTGTEFCKLAISETKAFSKWLTEEMEGRLPGFDQQIKLHVTGCTNSCGQSWIADIGLEGKKIKKDGKLVDAFYFCVGGAVGKYARAARQIGYRAAAEDTPEAVERLLRGYLALRTPGEDLRAYFARTSDEDLRTHLAGAVVTPVERDAPPAGGRHAADA